MLLLSLGLRLLWCGFVVRWTELSVILQLRGSLRLQPLEAMTCSLRLCPGSTLYLVTETPKCAEVTLTPTQDVASSPEAFLLERRTLMNCRPWP